MIRRELRLTPLVAPPVGDLVGGHPWNPALFAAPFTRNIGFRESLWRRQNAGRLRVFGDHLNARTRGLDPEGVERRRRYRHDAGIQASPHGAHELEARRVNEKNSFPDLESALKEPRDRTSPPMQFSARQGPLDRMSVFEKEIGVAVRVRFRFAGGHFDQ